MALVTSLVTEIEGSHGSEVTVTDRVILFASPSTGVHPVVLPHVCVASFVAVITYVALGAVTSTVAGLMV